MSYLDLPRLTFFGQFTANPSTINNFPPNYGVPHEYNTTSSTPGGVSWNPYGNHSFSLSANVTNLTPGPAASGSVMSAPAGPGGAVLVDLDTEQQMVSQIIGMKLTVTVGDGSVVGTFVPVNFFDIYFNRLTGSNQIVNGDGAAGAAYQSVLTDLQWNEGSSAFLHSLKTVSPTMLSIRFIVDGYNMFAGTPTFNVGRVAGTIGPQYHDEPTSFTNARFLRPTSDAAQNGWNYIPAKTDLKRRKLIVDLGNATAWTWNDSDPAPKSNQPSVQVGTISFNGNTPSGIIATFAQTVDTSDAAYQSNAFVQELDIPASIFPTIGSTPLGIISDGVIVATENPTGAYINADQYVFRLDPSEVAKVTIWANTFETPAANVKVTLALNANGLQPAGKAPVGTPKSGVAFSPKSAKTGPDGRATFTITGGNPKNPRKVYNIDGQVYGIGWSWSADTIPDPNAFLSVKVFDTVPLPKAPTWWGNVFPILIQYAYLYPAMQQIFELDDYTQVVANATQIIARLNLPETNPGMMPITRELSAAKKAILLKWAADPTHPEGKQPKPPPWLPPLPPQPST
ncbi:MAG TPA: hypothetical protein VJZ76_14155 [Thermoanaerobaculia bacterium]|nr:hypothetical protein [Thermoanaerobaculia bacterium]